MVININTFYRSGPLEETHDWTFENCFTTIITRGYSLRSNRPIVVQRKIVYNSWRHSVICIGRGVQEEKHFGTLWNYFRGPILGGDWGILSVVESFYNIDVFDKLIPLVLQPRSQSFVAGMLRVSIYGESFTTSRRGRFKKPQVPASKFLWKGQKRMWATNGCRSFARHS